MTLDGRARIAIVGLGTMGRIYLGRLRARGVTEIATIDPRESAGARFATLEDALAMKVRSDVWIVSTPTSSHVALATRLLEWDSASRIIIEKPVGRLDEVERLAYQLETRYTDAHVVVSDLYGRGRLADELHRHTAELPGKVTSVTMEMTKSRLADERSGRFVCQDYGLYGYEWFHMIRLLGAVLPSSTFNAMLSGVVEPRLLAHGTWEWSVDGIMIRASSSTTGVIRLHELDRRSRAGHSGRTPFRRLRVTTDVATLDCDLDDVTHATITIDRGPVTTPQTHLIERRDAVVEAVGDMLSMRDGAGSDLLRVDAHRMLTYLKMHDAFARTNQGESVA